MAQIIIKNGGSGGSTSDDCTATKNKVLEGYTAITRDSDDEIIQGTMKNLPAIDFAQSVSFSSSQFYVRMRNGAHIQNTSSGFPEVSVTQSQIASAGGLTAAKLLQGQTVMGVKGTATSDANAVAANILSGKTAYVKGKKITGTMTVNSVVSFKVAPYSTNQVLCTWTNPSKGPYSGFIICAKAGSYPVNRDDSRKYTGVGNNKNLNAANSVIISGLNAGTTYYFRIWTYCTVSTGNLYSGYVQSTCKVTSHGRVAFTTSGSWTVPSGVRSIDVHCTGAGGGGSWWVHETGKGAGGGGGGKTSYKKAIAVTPGQKINYTVGAGGVNAGGDSSVTINDIVIQAIGGYSPETNTMDGGSGGSGGGNGARPTDNDDNRMYAGNGGSNGSNGWNAWASGDKENHNGAHGQGTTTREFGESNGTLYSGGGGGGGYYKTNSSTYGGLGGDGGGGRGGWWPDVDGTDGTSGTGGGGGGAPSYNYPDSGWMGSGGSGNVVIRW